MRALAFLLMLSPTAQAAWPEDVSVSSMTEYDGVRVLSTDVLSASYVELIRELGSTVGSHVVLPAESLGARGFEITLDTTTSFISSAGISRDPSPWMRAHVDQDPGALAYLPGVTIRKGLPMSIDIGVGVRWLGNTRQAVVHGFARVALVEGFKPWPDVNFHMGYAGYVGNPELELGVFEAGFTLGTKAPFGVGRGPRNAKISPFVDVSVLAMTSTPLVDDEVVAAVGAVTYGRRGGNAELASVQRALVLPKFSGGVQWVFGQVSLRLTGGYTLNATPYAAASLGFTY
jgi:hypothetical protein